MPTRWPICFALISEASIMVETNGRTGRKGRFSNPTT
jgi:hypothetical protein